MNTPVPLSVIFGLGSALFWGASDFAGGLGSRRDNAFRVLLTAEWVGLFCLLPFPFIFQEQFPPVRDLLWSGLASTIGMAGLLMLYRSLAEGLMSVASPISALLAAAIVVLVGIFTEGFPGWIHLVGFFLSFYTIWLTSSNSGRTIRLRLVALRLPLLSGIAFGGFFILMHAGSQNAIFWPLISARFWGGAILLIYMMITRKPLLLPGAVLPLAGLCGLVDVIANACYVMAGRAGRLDVAAVIGSLYPGTTVLLAWFLLKERLSRPQTIGVVLALIAIVLISS